MENPISAQNGFGGYTRDSIEKHLQIDKYTANVTEISKKEYTNKMIEFFDRRNQEQYSESLSALSVDIPFDFICDRNVTYECVVHCVNGKDGVELDAFNYKSGEQKGAVELRTQLSHIMLLIDN